MSKSLSHFPPSTIYQKLNALVPGAEDAIFRLAEEFERQNVAQVRAELGKQDAGSVWVGGMTAVAIAGKSRPERLAFVPDSGAIYGNCLRAAIARYMEEHDLHPDLTAEELEGLKPVEFRLH